MRNIAILCLLLACTLPALAGTYRADEIPNVQRMDRRRYVSDPDGILSAGAVARIDSLCGALRERGVAEVAVAVVEDIASDDVFSFAYDLFSAWGVGREGRDDGLGILLVTKRREIRFVTGYGLEGVLPDALCKRIQMRYMLPAFREGDYDRGMTEGVEAVARLLAGDPADAENADDGRAGELPLWAILLVVGGVVVLPAVFSLAAFYRRRRCPRCRRFSLRLQSQETVRLARDYREVEYTFVCPHCGAEVRRRVRSQRGDRLGGGGGGPFIGGFGPGGGSFGGGSFGGGFGGGAFGGGGAGSKW